MSIPTARSAPPRPCLTPPVHGALAHIAPISVAHPDDTPRDASKTYTVAFTQATPLLGSYADLVVRMGPGPARPPSVRVLDVCGEGALSDAYAAVLHIEGAMACVLKVLNLDLFPDPDRDGASEDEDEDEDDSDGYEGFTAPTARAAMLNEAAVYRHMGHLQGVVVPRYFGIAALEPLNACVDEASGLCALIEDVGGVLPESDKGDVEVRAQIRALYQQLHAAGVLHLDVVWRHIRRGVNGKLTLIDFDQSDLRVRDEDGWADAVRVERTNVEALWGGVLDESLWHGQ